MPDRRAGSIPARIQWLRRADPHARVKDQLTSPSRGRFLGLDAVLSQFQRDRRAGKKLAVVFTGGGARGPYEGGVVEALVQAFRTSGVTPDVVCGASVGAINALCLFVDLMYPQSAPDPASHFLARQSPLWRGIGAGNNGAPQVVDKPWLIEYVTGKKPIPGLGNLENAWQQLGQAWQTIKGDLAGLAPAGRK